MFGFHVAQSVLFELWWGIFVAGMLLGAKAQRIGGTYRNHALHIGLSTGFDKIDGALHVGLLVVAGARGPQPGIGRDVDDDITPIDAPLHGLGVGDIAHEYFNILDFLVLTGIVLIAKQRPPRRSLAVIVRSIRCYPAVRWCRLRIFSFKSSFLR